MLLLILLACVTPAVPEAYARRAHPECEAVRVAGHQLASTSVTEVDMVCGGAPRTIAVKCEFAFGILSDTVCHENN